jgi:hypothetical protein
MNSLAGCMSNRFEIRAEGARKQAQLNYVKPEFSSFLTKAVDEPCPETETN